MAKGPRYLIVTDPIGIPMCFCDTLDEVMREMDGLQFHCPGSKYKIVERSK